MVVPGIRYKAVVIADLFWKPFDVRFETLLGRMRAHKSLFNSELQLEESRFMEMQFERRENDAGMAKDALEQIQQQIQSLRESNGRKEAQLAASFDQLSHRLKILTDSLEVSATMSDDEDDKTLGAASRHPLPVIYAISNLCTDLQLAAATKSIKSWVNPPDYRSGLEDAESRRAPRTCEWFVTSKEYTAWKSYVFPDRAAMGLPSSSKVTPILLVEGMCAC